MSLTVLPLSAAAQRDAHVSTLDPLVRYFTNGRDVTFRPPGQKSGTDPDRPRFPRYEDEEDQRLEKT
ncbi:MAG: hypothetical protein ACT4P3_01320 [Betaproteobacteria bacterium]